MNNELTKRILSSFVLIPISFYLILEGKFLFNIFLILIFLISTKEWFELSRVKFLSLTGFLFLIFSFFTIYQIRNLVSLNNENLFYFFLVLVICISTDIGGYLFGNIFKGSKLTTISPKKTVSGLFGAFILSLILTSIYLAYSENFFINFKEPGDEIYFIIIFISAVSQIGDILISFFKRSSNKKDTGNLIPGHGGILDRIDGMIFSFPITYILITNNFL